MQNTKHSVIGLALCASIIVAAAMFTGCTTTTVTTLGGQTNVVQVLNPNAAAGIRAVVAVAVPVAIKEDTNAAPYLALVANVFSMAAETGTYDPATLQASLDAMSIRELRDSATAKQIVVMAFAAYKGLYADAANAKLDTTTWGPFAKSLLGAIADGINAGLK
jgi:hypothetical protein